ncbi:hypothetical protein PRNP1_012049 [Phytophthora ramorum]
MKIASAAATTYFALAYASTAHGADAVERKLVLGGEVVPAGTKTYNVGVRTTKAGSNACGGALISPTHVLTASHCSSNYDIRWVSVGSHYINGSSDGEQIKVASIMNHPEYESGLFPNDFLILELQKPSSFTPVKIAAADDSDFAVGKAATIFGWGHTSNNGSVSYELRGVDVPLWDDGNCSKVMDADASMVCAGGVANKDACERDSGGPLVVESGSQDVVVGVSSWGPSPCGTEGAPGVYSRVSHARAWIDSVVNGTCFA